MEAVVFVAAAEIEQEISQQQYDQAMAVAQASAASVEAASANVNAAEQMVIQARGKLEQAEANLRTAGTAPKQVEIIRSRSASAEADVMRRKAGLDRECPQLSTDHFVRPSSQLTLF